MDKPYTDNWESTVIHITLVIIHYNHLQIMAWKLFARVASTILCKAVRGIKLPSQDVMAI
jgi:hypothetical protein